MCRHLLRYLRLLVSYVDTLRTCVDTSSLHSSVLIHCLHVLTFNHQFSKLCPLITCVNTSDSCIDSWSFIFKTLASIFVCRLLKAMCWHFHFQIVYYFHVSTPQSYVSTLSFPESILYALSSCVDTTRSCVNTSCLERTSMFSLVIWASNISSKQVDFHEHLQSLQSFWDRIQSL